MTSKDLPRLRFDQYFSLVVIGLGLLLMPIVPKVAQQSSHLETFAARRSQDYTFLKPADIPVLSETASPSAVLSKVSARAVYVTDEDSGAILLQKNAHESLFPASTTKLMTALVARDTYYLSQVLDVTANSKTIGNVIDLVPGEKISVQSLLEGLLVSSGNDAAMVFAINYPQGYDGFIAAMNAKAQSLGLTGSHFTNPAGLDEPTHQVTARDLDILMREVLKDDQLKEIIGTQKAQVTDTAGNIVHTLYNTNQLLSDPSIKGGKTGTTEYAKQVLVSVVEKDGHKLIMVVMGSDDRYADTEAILNWIFQNYSWTPAQDLM